MRRRSNAGRRVIEGAIEALGIKMLVVDARKGVGIGALDGWTLDQAAHGGAESWQGCKKGMDLRDVEKQVDLSNYV